MSQSFYSIDFTYRYSKYLIFKQNFFIKMMSLSLITALRIWRLRKWAKKIFKIDRESVNLSSILLNVNFSESFGRSLVRACSPIRAPLTFFGRKKLIKSLNKTEVNRSSNHVILTTLRADQGYVRHTSGGCISESKATCTSHMCSPNFITK